MSKNKTGFVRRLFLLSSLFLCLSLAADTLLPYAVVTADFQDSNAEIDQATPSSGPLDLWVDAVHGNDRNNASSQAAAVRTIQRAADLAIPGTTVHIEPGVYRETVYPGRSGTAAQPIRYVAEAGPGTAILRGSEPSSSLRWNRLSSNTIGLPPGIDPTRVYYADLSAWALDNGPRFVVHLDTSGEVVRRLPLAREPDWQVTNDWKHHEFWWAADGGHDVARCDPATDPDSNCDAEWQSTTQLTDRTNDREPAGIEPGNLTTIGDLTSATLVVLDTRQGHRVFRRKIASHETSAGRITVDQPCTHGASGAALGWGSKYYVESKPSLLDTPGEWWYDTQENRLYLLPPENGDPATMNIEIARRQDGLNLRNRSYVTFDGLSLEFYNEHAIYHVNNYTDKSYHNIIKNVKIRYANWGLWLLQSIRADEPAENVTDGFTLENSEIAHIDQQAIRLAGWWDDGADPDSFSRSPVRNTIIRGNDLHHLGFRTESEYGYGAAFFYADRLRFEENHVHHTAHHGVQFFQSVIQSSKEWGFAPSEIKTGQILVKDNLFEDACQLTTECAALKIWGSPPDNHVYREFLVTGNIFRDSFGWTYVAQERGRWVGGENSDIRGMGAFGLDIDMASGVHLYRNIFYNNAYGNLRITGAWRDGNIVCYNNILANSLYGIYFGGTSFDTHPSVNTQIVNNVLVNNEGRAILQSVVDDIDETILIDHNLYYLNGWRSYDEGGLYEAGNMTIQRRTGGNWHYQTLRQIQDNTPWEPRGVEGNPQFWVYDLADRNLHDGSWPFFGLTPSSIRAIDRGAGLPSSLTSLLNNFAVSDARWGTAYDIGRYEWCDCDKLSHIYLPVVLQRAAQ
jgi:hypothetical protein